MPQENRVPAQIRLDSYIAHARILRSEALAALGKQLFRWPSQIIEKLYSLRTARKKRVSLASVHKIA